MVRTIEKMEFHNAKEISFTPKGKLPPGFKKIKTINLKLPKIQSGTLVIEYNITSKAAGSRNKTKTVVSPSNTKTVEAQSNKKTVVELGNSKATVTPSNIKAEVTDDPTVVALSKTKAALAPSNTEAVEAPDTTKAAVAPSKSKTAVKPNSTKAVVAASNSKAAVSPSDTKAEQVLDDPQAAVAPSNSKAVVTVSNSKVAEFPVIRNSLKPGQFNVNGSALRLQAALQTLVNEIVEFSHEKKEFQKTARKCPVCHATSAAQKSPKKKTASKSQKVVPNISETAQPQKINPAEFNNNGLISKSQKTEETDI